MPESTRILILEDNPTDAELAQFELQEAGMVFTAKVVMTEKDYIHELRVFSPDLILSDYDLPTYNGALALGEAKKRRPDTPFILVTGAVSEDRAIEILTQGAKDYVLKTRLEQRLVPAVRRALAEAAEHRARKQAEAELREAHRTLEKKVKIRTAELEAEMAARKKAQAGLQDSEKRYRRLFETSKDGILILDANTGKVDDVNPFLFELLGYSYDELYGKYIWEIGIFKDIAASKEAFKTLQDNEYIRYNDLPLETVNGQIIAVEFVSNVYLVDHHKVIQCNIRDITEHKKAEDALRESEMRFRTMANSIPQLAWMARADGFIFWYNQRWYDYTGTTPEQMEGWGWQSVHDKKVLPEVMERWGTAIATGEPFDMEFPLLGADKIFRPFLTRVLPLKNERGRVIQWFGTNTDLSERKRAEEELALSEREFRLLAESMPQIVWTTRVDGWNTYFNQKWVDYTGLTLEESYGHGWNKPFHPDDQQRAWDAWQNAVLHNAPYLLQCRLRRADGIYRWWLIHGVPVLDENGKMIKWYGTCTDINDLKQAEEAMLLSQNQFNLLIKNIRSGMALIDDAGSFAVVNPSFLRMFGLKDDETIVNVNDKDWSDWQVFESDGTLLHVDEHPVRKAAITGKPVKDKLVGVRLPSGGDMIWMLVSADLVLRPDGSIQSTICTYYDITELMRAEEAMRKNEGKWSAALENLCTGAIIASEAEQVIYWNPIARAMHGFKSEDEGIEPLEDTPNTFELWTRDGTHQLILDEWPMRRIKRGESVRNLELRLRRPDQGWEKFVLYSGDMIETTGGERLIFLSVHEITEQKKAEHALKEQTQRLEEANKELESFSYSVSHDLRAPLRAIDGFSRKLEREYGDKADEKFATTIKVIRDNAKMMGNLIDDLLSFSKVQKTGMNTTTIDMDQLTAEVWHDIFSANRRRELELTKTNILPGRGDAALIRQVLFNLFSNAVKFTKDRKPAIIEISSHVDADKVVYCIKDNGVGFDMEYYDKLFGVFQRLHSHDEYEGTGIGLAIVQQIIKRHGGDVWAQGEVGKGATFYFSLPSLSQNQAAF